LLNAVDYNGEQGIVVSEHGNRLLVMLHMVGNLARSASKKSEYSARLTEGARLVFA